MSDIKSKVENTVKDQGQNFGGVAGGTDVSKAKDNASEQLNKVKDQGQKVGDKVGLGGNWNLSVSALE